MKLGIVGAGMIAKEFLSLSPELPQIELAAILSSERSLAKTKELQATHNIGAVFTDYQELLQAGDVDTIYVALPNHLHFQYAKEALLADKHVICEKPFTLELEEALELQALAQERELLIFEAITNQYLGNFQKIKEYLPEIGRVHMISGNYSQYSSRYDAFQKGEILPAFDPSAGGGALMDINIYNLHLVVGLFGAPRTVNYYPNIQREVDTSGVVVMDYDQAKAICIGSKDTGAESYVQIQGELGEIIINSPSSTLISGVVKLRNGQQYQLQANTHPHRMYEEFQRMTQAIHEHDTAFADEKMAHTLAVMGVLEQAKS